jgi:hypothetical protein
MAKRKVDVKHQCHLCDLEATLYFDYKKWCIKCGREPLTVYNKTIKKQQSKNLSEEELNNTF